MPCSKKTLIQAFNKRFNDERNIKARGVVLSGETHNILLQHTQLLIAISSALAKKGELNGIEVSELAMLYMFITLISF